MASATSTAPKIQLPDLPLEVPGRDLKTGWRDYFSKNRPDPDQIARLVVQLHDAKRDADVVAVIEAAILHGQSQPWMYEVLATAMKVIGRPQADIERVLLSAVDFSAVDVPNMLLSAAYLNRYGLPTRALSLFRQATELSPSHPDAYVQGLKLARDVKDIDGIEWAATGILTHVWNKDHEELHRQAEDAIAEAEALLKKTGDQKRIEQFQSRVIAARQRDLVLKLTWNGSADLDMSVDEPLGTVCSRQNRYSRGGGVLVHDGYGPKPQNSHELYVCPRAAPGEYKVTIHHVVGNVVGKQAKLSIIRHQGTGDETTNSQIVTLVGKETVLRLGLKEGRRTELSAEVPVSASTQRVQPDRYAVAKSILDAGNAQPPRVTGIDPIRQRDILFQNLGGFQAAAQPVVQNFSEGVQLGAMAVVSPDRRYVRLSLNPTFTAITDVFTFTFAGNSP